MPTGNGARGKIRAVLLQCCCVYNMWLLTRLKRQQSADTEPAVRTYGDVAARVYGARGRARGVRVFVLGGAVLVGAAGVAVAAAVAGWDERARIAMGLSAGLHCLGPLELARIPPGLRAEPAKGGVALLAGRKPRGAPAAGKPRPSRALRAWPPLTGFGQMSSA